MPPRETIYWTRSPKWNYYEAFSSMKLLIGTVDPSEIANRHLAPKYCISEKCTQGNNRKIVILYLTTLNGW
jgi:hypothetical protein